MASMALGIAGSFFGGPIGGIIGSVAGSLIDQKLFGPPPRVVGKLTDLTVTSSTYGQPIPLVYGTSRISGNVIQSTRLHQHETSSKGKSGGKGGPTVINYTYTASFAIGICKGPITAVWRIWADGSVIYDARPSAAIAAVRQTAPEYSASNPNPLTGPKAGGYYRYIIPPYLGTETQTPDPTLEAYFGTGQVSAYRGLAYVVFNEFPVTNFGNRIPNFTFEVVGISDQEPNLTFDDAFKSNNKYFVPSSPSGGYAAIGTDANGNSILNAGNTVLCSNPKGATVWTKTPSDIVTDCNLSIPSSNIGYFSAGPVLGGSYIVMCCKDIVNQIGYLIAYQVNATGSPTMAGFRAWNSQTFSMPYLNPISQFMIANGGTISDPVIIMGTYGIGGVSTGLGIMPSVAEIITFGGGVAIDPSGNANFVDIAVGNNILGAQMDGGTSSSPMGFVLPTILASPLPPGYSTACNFYIYFNSGFMQWQAANPTSPLACPIAQALIAANPARANGAVICFPIDEPLAFVVSPSGLPSYDDVTDTCGLGTPWLDEGTYLTTGGSGSGDAYAMMPIISQQAQDGSSYIVGFGMMGNDDSNTNRNAASVLFNTRIFGYDPVAAGLDATAQCFTALGYNGGQILTAADLGGSAGGHFSTTPFTVWNNGGVLELYGYETGSTAAGTVFLTEIGSFSGTQGCSLAKIVQDISERSGLPDSDMDVTALESQVVDGYCLTHQMNGRTGIEPLQQIYFFDGIESDWKIKWNFRTGIPAGMINAYDLGARSDAVTTDVAPVVETRLDPIGLPQGVVIKYMLPDIDYQVATEQAKRPFAAIYAQNLQTLEASITMQPADAKKAAEQALYLAWVQRVQYTLQLPRTILQYDPGDVMILNYVDDQGTALAVDMYMSQIDFGADELFKVQGVLTDASLYYNAQPPSSPSNNSASAGGAPSTQIPIQPVNYELLDMPLIDDSDDTPGFYAAAWGTAGAGWLGGPFLKSTDGGSSYSQIDTFKNPTIVGTTLNRLPSGATASTQWNANDAAPGVSVSNSGRTMGSGAAGWSAIRSTTSKLSGKFYFETHLDSAGAANYGALGISEGGFTISAGYYPGASGASRGVQSNGSPPTYHIGDTLCHAVDLDNSMYGVRTNGGSWYNLSGTTYNPSSGSGGTSIPSATAFYAMAAVYNSGQVTLSVVNDQFSYSIPNLFYPWDNNVVTAIPGVWDQTSSVIVQLDETFFSLASCTPDQVLANNNVAMIGNEMVGFCNVDQLAPGVYQLSLLLRGMQGTDWAIDSHATGETFTLLSTALLTETISQSEVGIQRYYEAYSQGFSDVSSLTGVAFTCKGIRIKPLAPCHVGFTRDGSNNITMVWTPRRRLSDDIIDGVDQYIDESVEAYQVDILVSGVVVRTINVSSPTCAYSAANQTSDGLTPGNPVTVNIYQMSSRVGRGYPKGFTG